MRVRFSFLSRALAVATIVAGTAFVAAASPASAVGADPYTFRNVEVHGGGFVPGIVYNRSRQNLVYARTDIGGAYRWNSSTGRWIPLNDGTAPADWNLFGIDALATDPVDPNRLYLLAGAYTQSWAGNAAVLRSTDQGATFARTDLPFKSGGNESGRSMGERLMVDPNRNSTVYMGTRNDGLWRSTDYGATWARVSSFPATGQAGIGIGWIEFDKSSATTGNTTQRIYVGVGSGTSSVYRSTDGGNSWAPVPGQPNAGMPHHGRLSANNGTLYVTYGDQPGPYTMASGGVWKLNTATGAWTDITPLVPNQNGESGFGYAGLAVDGTNPNTIMVATMGRWGPVDDIFRSTNGGTSWVSVTAHKTMDTSAAPYLSWHETPKLGWMIGSLEIDPFNPNRFLYGTGATIFGTDAATNLDSGGSVTITSRAHGLEETAVLDLISPPSGPPLISALGDIGVFRHDNLAVVPPNGMADNPIFGSTSSLDFAEASPGVVYRAGYMTPPATGLAYSLDGGDTWSPVGSMPENPEGAGKVAVSADGATVLWSPSQRGVYRSTNRGGSWTASGGISGSGVSIRSDRVNPNKFYAFVNGIFYVSTNAGVSFTAAASGLPTGSTYFKPVPGRDGDVWVTTGTGGLHRSTNSGGAFTKLANVAEAYTVGFGRAAPGQTYPAVYINGIVDGINGLFRSDDAGATWVRINDDGHQYGWIGQTITGDPRVYGRVYVSTNGRGIIYGDRAGGGDTTPPSAPGTPVASGVAATSATLTWGASTDNVGVAGYDVINASNTVVASSTATSATLTGLSPNTQYVLRVRARDAAGNQSTPSASVTFTTATTSDPTPPSTPGTPAASAIASTSATLTWGASTDNVGVAGYHVYREQGATDTLLATPTTNTATLTGLSPNTQYQVYVRARDAVGNLSANSAVVTFTTTGTGGGGCAVTYTITSQWPGGFGAAVRIANTGTTAINGWTLTWTFPNSQSVTQMWQATPNQSGATVTATNPNGYNNVIAANGGSVDFGFNGSWTGTNAKPASFTLNGNSCTTG